MSWLRNTSLSFARQLSRSLDPRHDYEPQACYNSFCKHWQQANDIITKSQVIAAEPFLRPLLKLLSSFRNELPTPNLENQLITVLNQLCVALMQNMKFLDLFFLTTHSPNGSQAEFIIVRLLLTSVHREGSTGSAARDALLLCANMSSRCPQLAEYMLNGNTCPVLATGLSGLYSLLPRTLSEKVHRLTPDDVNKVNKLTLFIDSLEFCNAVAQVAHPSIKKHLLDLLYQGFLVPVMGPALLQTKGAPLQSGAAEQAAAMAYLELLLRCVTQRGLLKAVLHFLFAYEYDGVRVIDVLLKRLEGDSQLSLVSLSLMETLIDLNCEDVMIELVFKYLLNGHHLMASHRHKISDPTPYREAAIAFLALSPECCTRPIEKTREWVDDLALSGRRVLDLKLEDEKRINGVNDGIAMTSLVQEVRFNYGNPNETLYANYHAYLCDARFEIVSRALACSNWSAKYSRVVTSKRETNNNSKETREIDVHLPKEQDSLISCTSGYDTLKTSDSSEKEPLSLTSLLEQETEKANAQLKEQDGPLISSLLRKAAYLLESDVTVNTRVTSALSKLVSLPTPLLTSLLLCPNFVLQPNVPSLFQILNKLKDEVDELTTGLDNIPELVDKARVFLIQRELTLVKSRAAANDDAHTHAHTESPANKTDESPFRRVEAKRRSISSSLSNMFGRRSSTSTTHHNIQSPQPMTYIASPLKHLMFTQEEYWSQSITLRSILNAVLLDEWIKELAAMCEEHALRLSAEHYEDDTYVRSVAL
ncbi:hypothetical protein ACJJTC_014660 [Scirpophaga incertulas]